MENPTGILKISGTLGEDEFRKISRDLAALSQDTVLWLVPDAHYIRFDANSRSLWSCRYCGNLSEKLNCPACGAPRGKL